MMDTRSLKVLEFDKIVERLAGKAISPAGKALCGKLAPMGDLEQIQQALTETQQALDFSMKAGHLPLGGIKDIAPSLKRASFGGTLNTEELFHIGEFIYVCRKVQNYAKSVERREYLDLLDPLFEQVEIPDRLEKDITRCIANEKEVSDEASAVLSGIRRGIKLSHGRINEALQSVIHSNAYKNMLQDAVITIRSGRFCVPIKQEYKGAFPGMIHDMSGSGATVFMEPMSVVALNNKIKELEAEEKEEVERILAALTTDVAENTPVLETNLETLTILDFIFAKSALALDMQATNPELNDFGMVNISKGRHPLLNVEKVVPMDIRLGDEFSALLITGPNTGGKTVALKILGLFSLMGMAGLFIPADFGSKLSIFDSVFADIGDEQSIEQSLSTFSAHMTNIVRILGLCTFQSLVLFDELGSGTDPTEGSALAISIIRNLMARGVKCAITTHYSELKIFALSTDGVENGAVEFDVQTLAPTYRLLIGVPGKSNAFAIAGRLGLTADIISQAKELLTNEDIRFEDVITDLEISKKAVEVEEERAAQLRHEAQKLADELETQKRRITQNREKILNEAKLEAREMLARAKEEADSIIKDMRKIQHMPVNLAQAEESRKKLKSKMDDMVVDFDGTAQAMGKLRPIDRQLAAGDAVFINSLGQRGQIVDVEKNQARVTFGSMEMKVKISDLSLEEGGEVRVDNRPKSNIRPTPLTHSKAAYVSPGINLRGMLVEEALEELSKYLDDAFLANMGKVEIVHGKGTGALRAAVQKYLKNHPHIKSHRLGEFGEGDSGITIAELK
ncbi:MAG: endonuclease MutS2 [Defluviitaleaceae bacterium]|nr:endonuclease MutS2 [Defluviitaleaceae bacterium]